MLKWLRARLRNWLVDAPVPATPKRHGGFFSTDIVRRAASDDPKELALFLTGVAGQSIQRPAPIEAVRMDAIADDYGNTRVAFAMDDWSGAPSLKSQFAVAGVNTLSTAIFSWFAAQAFIGYQACAILAQQWLVDKACTMPARDATRNGYEITVNDGTVVAPEVLDYMRKLDKRFKVKANAREFVRNSRIFGIRIALFEVRSTDPDYYLKPFNPDGVMPGSYEGISQVDPYWITPELDLNAASNPASSHFYEPTYWRVNGVRYHRSHLIISKTCEVPDVLKPTYFYGGIPLPQRIYERIYAAERTANEAPQLALTKRATIIHVDLAAAVANQKDMEDRLGMWAYFRDNYGVKVLGQDETAEQFDTALNDLDETIMTQFQLVAAIAEVPATKLLGTTPKGFNATGEYEEASYHELLESIQEHDVAPLVERHHLLCVRSYVVPKFGIAPFETTAVFNELDAETSKEKADRRLVDAQADKAWADTGAVDGIDIRDRLIADEDSGFSGIARAIPEGPRPAVIVDPGATKAAPNDPTPAETAAKPSGLGST